MGKEFTFMEKENGKETNMRGNGKTEIRMDMELTFMEKENGKETNMKGNLRTEYRMGMELTLGLMGKSMLGITRKENKMDMGY